ncbi:sodium/hydrogen exchanger [Thermocrinis albus DSM 14484]|uniref:Sodium/hydrogen exchanger n=1 Tax=Thermocrinis albus (strain DSM 14484 / JCM 11386 / HI 11/12) TaxID=638303 RepID=D3SNG0_THEAH|nr:cation:proton antiporter [Thermocrinis albus]ADC88697.1 sodium/hydrogen exchanger [Thermocrinis albus DSM 14484]
MNQTHILWETGILFTTLYLWAYLLARWKVPYIVSFLLAGFVGKLLFPLSSLHVLSLLEQSAVILLFFFVGLEYSFERLAGMWRVITPSLVDLLLNLIPLFLLAYLITKDPHLSFVLAAALYPSSTAIVAKLMTDYRRLILPEADLLIGILIFEDLVAILLLSVVSAKTSSHQVHQVFLTVILTLTLFVVLRRQIASVWGRLERQSQENIFPLLLLGLLLGLAGLSSMVGVPEALVAFLLGVSVPEESQTFRNIERSLWSLRELAVAVFFFSFTYHTDLSQTLEWNLILVLLLASLLLKTLSTFLGGLLYGLSRRVSLRASLSFLPKGEFSVIMASYVPAAQPIVFLVVISTALLGSIFFILAPYLTKLLFSSTKKVGPPPAPPS